MVYWKENSVKILAVGAVVTLTVAIHYGWVIQPIFGHQDWVHALHRRFCYIPIVIACAWFGLRGGLITTTAISALIIPYIYLSEHAADPFTEYTEIVFYYALAVLAGALVDRELKIRRQHEQSRIELERSKRLSMMGQLAAGVAHEIKNPLASIKGATEILTDRLASEQDKEDFAEIVRREVKRIDTTVGEFLTFARPPAPVPARIDWSEELKLSLKQFEREASSRGVKVETVMESAVFVNGDRERLHQVALNLLLNALQATPDGGRIQVDLARLSALEARLSIHDTGSGIEPENLPRIFEPFYTTRSSGTGLGLAIVKTIIDAHHGTIAATSEPGKGTTMTVTLPSVG
jgi:two-component system sensor histidine kinase HydH